MKAIDLLLMAVREFDMDPNETGDIQHNFLW